MFFFFCSFFFSFHFVSFLFWLIHKVQKASVKDRVIGDLEDVIEWGFQYRTITHPHHCGTLIKTNKKLNVTTSVSKIGDRCPKLHIFFKLERNDCDKPAAVNLQCFESPWQRCQTNYKLWYDNDTLCLPNAAWTL